MASFNKGEHSRKGARGSFCSKMFYNGYENLIELPNFVAVVPCLAPKQLTKVEVAGSGKHSSLLDYSKNDWCKKGSQPCPYIFV